MKNFFIFIVVFCFNTTIVFSQKSDTLALNSNTSKKILPLEIDENSGLIYLKNLLFTFNDSGGKPEIYTFNPVDGSIKNTIYLKNASNIDWEAITTDGETIYIGDFGNNRGNRKDLSIYKIKIDEINFELAQQEVENLKITFEIEGQTTFENLNRKNDFDIESMVFYNQKIHFFTKEWVSMQTTHHTLNPNILHQISQKIETFPVSYCVTDASIDQNNLLLVGYTKESLAYLSIFTISDNELFFNQPQQKIFLGLTPGIGQIEGITTSDKHIYISGEAMKYGGFNHDQVFYTLDKMY